MVDLVSVCNTALALTGTRSTIASLAENSKEAQACALFVDNIRTSALRIANWNFAKTDVTLALYKAAPGTPENPTSTATVWDNTMPPVPWLYTYVLPTDCLKVRYVKSQPGLQSIGVPVQSSGLQYVTFSPADTPPAYEIAGDKDPLGNDINVLLTNERQAIICYTKDVSNPDLWDSGFFDLVTASLASAICLNLTGDKALAKLLSGEARDAMLTARLEDANENLTVMDRTPEALRVRGSIFDAQGLIANRSGY